MSFWKTICTCAGCIAGAVCVVASGGTLLPLVIAAGGGAIAGNLVGHKMDQDEKKTKNQEQELAIRNQTIESLRKDNEKAQTEITGQNQKLEEINDKIKKREQEIKKIQNKLKDPNLSQEEKNKLSSQLALLLSQQDDDKKEKDDTAKIIKDLSERIKSNNKNITSVGSSSFDKDKGIMEYLTLQNILICFAIYALWQIVKDDRK